MNQDHQSNTQSNQITLYDKNSLEDLIMRGFNKVDIMHIFGLTFKNNYEYTRRRSSLTKTSLYKHFRKHYKLEYIKNNYSPEFFTSFFLSHKKPYIKKDYMEFGIRKGNRNEEVRMSDIAMIFDINIASLIKEKVLNTNLDKFGGPAPIFDKNIKEKIKNTNLERYGVENVFSSDVFIQKLKETNFKKYGTEYSVQSDYVKDKIKNTNLERYGAEKPLMNPDILKKTRESTFSKYGFPFSSQSPKGREIMRNAFKNKYGVTSPIQVQKFREKQENTNLKKFGYKYSLASELIREKGRKTCLEKYGTKWPQSLEKTKQKAIKTNLDKYGVEYPMMLKNVLEAKLSILNKISLEKYGEEWPKISLQKQKEALEFIKKMSLEKYGTEWPFHSKVAREKALDTKRKNGTFNTSLPEDNLHIILLEKFDVDNVFRNDNTHSEYPFAVDFYIKSQNLYIEYNGLWTHGKHFFNENSTEDQELLKKWQSKAETSKYYRNAINVWTNTDPKKRETAKNNNLNYVVLWNWNDVEAWISSGFELRKDY